MKKAFVSTVLTFAVFLAGEAAQASGPSFNVGEPEPAAKTESGPSFNTGEPASAPFGGDTSGPSFSAEPLPSLDPGQSAAQEAPAKAPQEFAESKAECRWLTSSIAPLYARCISNEAGQTEYIELEFRYQFTNRSEDRVFTALKDVQLVLACTVETPSGKAYVEIRHTNPLRKLKKQRGPREKVTVVYKLKADESCVVSKDEGVTWEDIAMKIPSNWWDYKISLGYTVVSHGF